MPRRLRKVPPVPQPSDPKFMDWLFLFRDKVQGDGQIAITQLAVGTGTANQLAGINSGATAWEYKTLSSGGDAIIVTNTTGAITLTAEAALESIADTSYIQGDLVYASGTDTLTRLAKNTSATRYLSNTGASNNPAWAQVDLTNGVTGTLPVANGGTGATTLTGILQGNGTSAVSAITNSSTVGQVLRVTGSATYAWGALDLDSANSVTGTLGVANGGTNLSAVADASVLVTNAADTFSVLTAGASQSIRRNAGNTAWEAYTPTSGTVTSVDASVSAATAPSANLTVSGGPITSSGTLAFSLTPWWVQKMSVASGEALTIASGYGVMIPREFSNSGTITNSGTLMVI